MVLLLTELVLELLLLPVTVPVTEDDDDFAVLVVGSVLLTFAVVVLPPSTLSWNQKSGEKSVINKNDSVSCVCALKACELRKKKRRSGNHRRYLPLPPSSSAAKVKLRWTKSTGVPNFAVQCSDAKKSEEDSLAWLLLQEKKKCQMRADLPSQNNCNC